MKICLPIRNKKGVCARVDRETAKWAKNVTWHIHKGYVATTIGSGQDATRLYLHRILVSTKNGSVVDHANGDRLDNRRKNLRVASVSENGANVKKLSTNRTGRKGVVKHGKKFRAYIHKDGKTKYLGTFDTAKEAACEYDRKARRMFGKFAKTNGTKCR